MFAWFFSLLLLFTNPGKATTVPSSALNGSGNRHVAPADGLQPDGNPPPDPDGTGHP
jgi:hypothetical protein